MTTNPRTIATTARGTVIIGSGLALGILTAHMYGQAALSAAESNSATTAAATSAKPKVVTVTRTKHVKSDPIIVYRKVPSGSGSSGSTYVPPSSTSSSGGSSGGGGNTAPAPAAPQPAAPAAPPAANSGAS